MALADLADALDAIARREEEDPESYPARTIADLYALGLPQAPFPRELGGSGASCLDATRAIEALAATSPSAALISSMPLGLAGVFASDESAAGAHAADFVAQRRRLADDYRAGRVYAACNSEKGAGGSLAATKTVAPRAADGTFRLSGEKILASSGRFAHTFFSTAKVPPEDLPGTGVVEFFFVPADGPGVHIASDWDGFGMRSTESQSVVYEDAPAREIMGFPNFVEVFQPVQYWYCLFAAIPLGCARGLLEGVGKPAPESPALRARLADAQMRYESLRAYLFETAASWRPAAGRAYAGQVLRTKTYVSQESVKLAAELFALGGGRSYRRSGRSARLLADSFAGTALRPPLTLGLDLLSEQFDLSAAGT
jgi:alkylation response protein AidB-like acyl-CoA dehydrogenase